MRVGIIGLGYRLGYLSRVFSAARPDFSIAGYVDPAPAGLPYATQHGVDVGKSFDSLEAMLDIQPALHGVGRGEAQPGDVLLMRFKKEPTHLGIHAGDNLIHCWQPVGMVCEHLLDGAWQRRVVAVYRFTGVDNG